MFGFARLSAGNRTAQPIDFAVVVRLFDLFGFRATVARKNCAGGRRSREDAEISFYLLKWNKWNSRTRQQEQRLSAFRTVLHCSAFAAPIERLGRLRRRRAIVCLSTGPLGEDLSALLLRAERDDALLEPALSALASLDSLDKRRVWASYAALNRPGA